jgi:hypothetical protein
MATVQASLTLKRVDTVHAGNISAAQRQAEFRQMTREYDGKLFCIACKKIIDHSRKSSVESHFKSSKHLKRECDVDMTANAPKVQKTITSTFQTATVAQKKRLEVAYDWVRTCAGAYIPLSNTDHPLVRNFLTQRAKNGGAIPGEYQLQDVYLPALYEEERTKLKEIFKDQPVGVMFDEMSDDEGRYVLNILIAPVVLDANGKVKSYLGDTVFLEKTKHSTVSQAVVQSIQSYEIGFENVVVFDTDNATDNAAYVKKAFETVLSGPFPNSVHCTCLANIINLVGESFRKPFDLLNQHV